MRLLLLMLTAPVALGACSTAPRQAPSLAPRAAEAIDPRLPVGSPTPVLPVSPQLSAQLAELIGLAKSGEAAFSTAADRAESLAAAAGAEGSESWVAAQQALSAAVAARAPTTRALGDIDRLAATAIAARGGMAAADLAAIQAAQAEVGAIDRRHADRLEALQVRLGS